MGPDSGMGSKGNTGNGDSVTGNNGSNGGNGQLSQQQPVVNSPPIDGSSSGLSQDKNNGNGQQEDLTKLSQHSNRTIIQPTKFPNFFGPTPQSAPFGGLPLFHSTLQPPFSLQDTTIQPPNTANSGQVQGNSSSQCQPQDMTQLFAQMQLQMQTFQAMMTTMNNNQSALVNEVRDLRLNQSNNGLVQQRNATANVQQQPNNQQAASQNTVHNNQAQQPTLHQRSIKCDIPKYDGKTPYVHWIENTIMLLEVHKVPQEQWMAKILSAMQSQAAVKLTHMSRDLSSLNTTMADLDLDEFLERLHDTMDDTVSGPTALNTVKNMKQGYRESASEYIERFNSLTANVRLSETDRINYLVLGLAPKLSDRILLTSNDGQTLTATNIETKVKLAEEYLKHHHRSVQLYDKYSAKTPSTSKSNDDRCYTCNKSGHRSTNCPSKSTHGQDKSKVKTNDKNTGEKKTFHNKEQVIEEEVEANSEPENSNALFETSEEESQ
ncbi:hypothetical protein HDE_04005 [Halotydeus destructor]|nr:hypothetical protein HDE_04005 [Halotydeus destructor]